MKQRTQTRQRVAGSHVQALEPRTHFAASAREVTTTALTAHAGALGQAITFDVKVRTAAQFGSPVGTVDITDHGNLVQELTLAPATSPNARFAISEASYTIPAGAGGQAYSVGLHAVRATYNGGSFLNSKTAAVFAVKSPHYSRQADGLRVATVDAGSGAAVAAGNTVTVLYTGYLAANGKIFDYSGAHSPGTFRFAVESSPEQVITGFDEGVIGMQVGETRAISIPWQLGYGATGNPPTIPAKANLIFLVTLESIS